MVSPSRVSQRGSERRCSAIVSGGAARSRLELSHAPTSTSIHLPAFSASDRFLVWTIRPGCLPPLLPALNPINNAVGSRLRVTAALPASRGFSWRFADRTNRFRSGSRWSRRIINGQARYFDRCVKSAKLMRRMLCECVGRKRYEHTFISFLFYS